MRRLLLKEVDDQRLQRPPGIGQFRPLRPIWSRFDDDPSPHWNLGSGPLPDEKLVVAQTDSRDDPEGLRPDQSLAKAIREFLRRFGLIAETEPGERGRVTGADRR